MPNVPSPQNDRRGGVSGTIVIGVIAVVLTVLWLYSRPRQIVCPASPSTVCKNYLKQIGLGLRQYCDTYGVFPPAYTIDASGRRLHSWRTLILPYIDQVVLYEQVRLNEPWNSPHNRDVFDQKREWHFYTCVADESVAKGWASYVAITGSGFLFNGPHPTPPSAVTDGVGDTIAVVEIRNSSIRWYEPRDLEIDDVETLSIGHQPSDTISSYHSRIDRDSRQIRAGAQVCVADGSARFLPDGLSDEAIRALLTIDADDESTSRTAGQKGERQK